jgi:hypothetical protein
MIDEIVPANIDAVINYRSGRRKKMFQAAVIAFMLQVFVPPIKTLMQGPFNF